MNTILVPTDFSQDAHDSLLYALEIAGLAGARIVLFHAFYQSVSPRDGHDFTTEVNELERQMTERLHAYAEKVRLAIFPNGSLKYHNSGEAGVQREFPVTANGFHPAALDKPGITSAPVDISCVSKFGFAFDEILKAVDVHRADLVVMGMRGEGALRRALLGRTTVNVIRDAKVPVLSIPLGARFKGLCSTVFAVDLLQLPPDAVLNCLRAFMKLFDSRLLVLHLFCKNSLQHEQEQVHAALGTLARQLCGIDYKVHLQLQEDAAEGIQSSLGEQQADLLALIPQKHPFLEELLHKSLTHKIISNAFVPLLALPADALENTFTAPARVAEAHL